MESDQYPQLAKPVRNLKIICGLVIVACGLALGVLLFNVDYGNLKTDVKLIVLLATVSTVALLVVAHVLFGIVIEHTSAKPGKRSPEERGFAVVRGAWQIRYTLLGAVFFLNLIVGLLENNLIPILIAALALLLMLRWFPRTTKLEKALSNRLSG